MAADLADEKVLPAIVEGIDRVFLATGNVSNMVQIQKNVIHAAEEAGIPYLVKVSALGASDHSKSVIGVWHYVVERALRESGLAWTILRPHVFMQNLLEQAESVRGEGRLYSPSASAHIPMIDTRDIAAVAAACLIEDRHAGQTYTLTGPAPISYGDAASILSEVLNRTIEYVQESETEAFVRLYDRGLRPWQIGAQLSLAAYQRAGGGTDILTDTVESVTGHAPRDFETFARDHVRYFR